MTDLDELLKQLGKSSILATIGTGLEAVQPRAALDYFKSLIPSLSIEPERYVASLRRAAFTMVAAAEETLLERTQALIIERLETGDVHRAPQEIDDLLDEIGCGPRNSNYSEMVWRTNAMDALVTGMQDEVTSDPELMEAFPVWRYLGIKDGREGADHRINFDLYFPVSMSFHEVRGPRVFNCRCVLSHVSASEWVKLQDQGHTLTTDIPRLRTA